MNVKDIMNEMYDEVKDYSLEDTTLFYEVFIRLLLNDVDPTEAKRKLDDIKGAMKLNSRAKGSTKYVNVVTDILINYL